MGLQGASIKERKRVDQASNSGTEAGRISRLDSSGVQGLPFLFAIDFFFKIEMIRILPIWPLVEAALGVEDDPDNTYRDAVVKKWFPSNGAHLVTFLYSLAC